MSYLDKMVIGGTVVTKRKEPDLYEVGKMIHRLVEEGSFITIAKYESGIVSCQVLPDGVEPDWSDIETGFGEGENIEDALRDAIAEPNLMGLMQQMQSADGPKCGPNGCD